MISNQVHFSLAHAGALEDLVPFAERENRIVIAYSPLAQGLLGGKYGLDNRPGGVRAVNPLFGTENLRRIEPLLQTLRDVAAEVDAKPAQVALAWLISLPGRRGDSRRLQRRAARVQRRRRRHRAAPGIPRRAHRGGARLQADVQRALSGGQASREARRPLIRRYD